MKGRVVFGMGLMIIASGANSVEPATKEGVALSPSNAMLLAQHPLVDIPVLEVTTITTLTASLTLFYLNT